MEKYARQSPSTPRRRPLRCWAGLHHWLVWRGENWYCRDCPATRTVNPATGKAVVDHNRALNKW